MQYSNSYLDYYDDLSRICPVSDYNMYRSWRLFSGARLIFLLKISRNSSLFKWTFPRFYAFCFAKWANTLSYSFDVLNFCRNKWYLLLPKEPVSKMYPFWFCSYFRTFLEIRCWWTNFENIWKPYRNWIYEICFNFIQCFFLFKISLATQ